ncbi:MAG: xanthine dehydrogenase family protein molybdopterin-binding subunit, partial [Acidimicrobiia bacterium]
MHESVPAHTLGRLVGSRERRVEDHRLLTGQGRYVDDVVAPGMAHAAFLRSPHAHARIVRIDIAAARRLDGVLGAFTGADIAAHTNPFVGMITLDGLFDPQFHALATDRVRLVGDPVAIVVARSRAIAEDACELIDVDYEPLEPIAGIADALDSTKPALWSAAGGNVLYRDERNVGEIDSLFAAADRVVTHRFRQHRQSNQPMEARGCVAELDPATGSVTYHSATQAPHVMRWGLGLMVGRSTMTESIRTLMSRRDNVTRFVKGTRAELSSRPELIGAGKLQAPAMLRQMRRQPQRSVALTKGLMALLAKSDADVPHVVAEDVGGAFGAKTSVSREDVAVLVAAQQLRCSVKWIEDRNEHLLVGAQAREETVDVSVAVHDDGTLLAMKADLVMDGGAYPGFPYAAPLFCQLARVMIPGPYRWKALGFRSRVVATNKATYCAYRGPWAVETWVRERMMDLVARELGISAAEMRLRNIIGPDELPTPMITGPMLDVRMSAQRTLTTALEAGDYGNWSAMQAAARAEGRLVGLGMSTFIEAAPGPPKFFDHVIGGFATMAGEEPARAQLNDDGTVSVFTQQMPHGQGHETTLAQVAADQLGVPMSSVRVVYGDTRTTPFGLVGTGGSRSAAMAGGAVTAAAATLRSSIVDLAADLLEAAREDVTITDGVAHVAGVPSRGVPLCDVADAARQRHVELTATGTWDGGDGGWAQATHLCWVEIDPATGKVHIDRYLVVEDCGELINPTIVDGQIAGGVAQGIGAVLYEKVIYDDNAQCQTGTFLDYLLPTAAEIPDIEIIHVQTPSGIT